MFNHHGPDRNATSRREDERRRRQQQEEEGRLQEHKETEERELNGGGGSRHHRRELILRHIRVASRSLLNSRERRELAAIIRRYYFNNSTSITTDERSVNDSNDYRTNNTSISRALDDLADSLWALLDTDDKRQTIISFLQHILPAADRAEFIRRLTPSSSADDGGDRLNRYHMLYYHFLP